MKKYVAIAEALKKIIENDLNVDKLPTEQELMNEYSVSRDTIRLAFKRLKDQDVIVSKRGSGYYVKRKKIHIKNLLNHDFTITEMVKNAGFKIGKINETIARKKTNIYAEYFGEEQDFYIIKRITTAEDKPIAFSKIILPVYIVGEDFPLKYRRGSLKEYLKNTLLVQTVETITRIEAIDKKVEKLPLEFKGLPMLKLVQNNKLRRGQTLLVTNDYIRTDMIELNVKRTPKRDKED